MNDPVPATSSEARCVAGWLAACRRSPGDLPDGMETVHRRLVRVVGRGRLPSGGLAFLKMMAFPRARDLLRYAVRTLPAQREARLLGRIAALDVGVELPEVLGVVAERRWGLPQLSVLVTRGLPVAGPEVGPLGVSEAAAVGARLADAGVWQRDFHRDNVLRLEDGRIGLLDVQSAQLLGRPLGRRERTEMAIKLLSTSSPVEEAEQLVEAGLVGESDLAAVVRRVATQRRADRIRQVRRCVRRSSAFRLERKFGERLYIRRAERLDPAATVGVEVGRSGPALWFGDRFLEVVDGRTPSLLGMRRNAWWRGTQDRVYIPPSSASRGFEGIRSELLEGYRRWVAYHSASEPAETSST